jgi:hypothetical protein
VATNSTGTPRRIRVFQGSGDSEIESLGLVDLIRDKGHYHALPGTDLKWSFDDYIGLILQIKAN